MSHAHDRGGSAAPDLRTERFPVTDLYCACCAESLEAALRASPHIERARVDFQNDAVEVTYHLSMISPQEIETLISRSGRCCPVGAPSTDMTHPHHRAQMAEVTAGSKQDRMQYEMPSTSAHKEHERGHHEAKGHAGSRPGADIMRGPARIVCRAKPASLTDEWGVARASICIYTGSVGAGPPGGLAADGR